MNNTITIEEIKKLLGDYDYYAENELIYRTFIGLYQYSKGMTNAGQDIFATCLEGPPGVGKTHYAETYQKLVKNLYGECELVSYQCDATTGKENLYEDIDIVATVSRDTNKIRIPGKIVEAINLVNQGKKVILFLDEYDKAREETDAFMLQFLQSGRINTNQFGDLAIQDEFKNNLQVIICKNDFRENVSGPLERRLRPIRLDYMLPGIFNQLSRKLLIDKKNDDDKVDEGLLNLVSLMYEVAYNNREVYTRLPSPSELMTAMEDANILVKYANAPKNIVYEIIIKGMFKKEDDIKLFESHMADNTNLNGIITSMKNSSDNAEPDEISLNDQIMESYFPQKLQELNEYMDEIAATLDEIDNLKDNPPSTQTDNLNQDTDTEDVISLSNCDLVYTDNDKVNFISNFNDSTEFIKRGKHITDASNNRWNEIATLTVPTISAFTYFSTILTEAYSGKIIAYEDGYQIHKEENYNFIMARIDREGTTEVKIFSDSNVISTESLSRVLTRLLKISTIIPITNPCDFHLEVKALIHNSQDIDGELYGFINGDYNHLYSLNAIFNSVDSLNDYINKLINIIEPTNHSEIKELSDKLNSNIKTRTKKLS